MYKIDLYTSANGHSEIQDFLNKLKNSRDPYDQSLFRKISYQIELLANLGPMIGEPQSKFIKGYRYPLMELRPMPERIFYSPCGIQRYVLLHHYTKRQNKTNVREIRKAISNLEDWIKRKKEEIYGNLE